MHLADLIERRSSSRTVGVMLPTGAAFPMAALAGWMLGRVVVPLNYLLKEDELNDVIEDCETDVVLTASPLLQFLGYTPRVRRLIAIDELGPDAFRGVPEPRLPRAAAPDDLAVLLYTSGTTGRPKGAMLTHANLTANIRQCREWIHFDHHDRILGVLPQFHSFGLTVLTLLPLTAGLTVVYTARFVPAKILHLLREHRPTMFIAIPSMYGALLHAKSARREDFASLRIVVSGGEPLPTSIAEGFYERFGVRINEGFGMTETAPVTHWCRPGEYRPRSVGMPLPCVEQRIVDINTSRDLPPGEEGELRLRGPNVMRGYFKRPEETARMFDERGWLRTGDMARIDRDGFLSITGRLKEMLIVGGENVFPREIEEALESHPSVAAAGVVGAHDDIRGEIPVAFVELREGAAFDERALQAWCRERLAGYKVPREVRALDALPRNPTGKLLRRELQKMLAASPA
ncbi:MAG: AMP-binding protein [Phycisphaerales bacterium]|jgi:long-chain acyl-CoA synthetase|nr:AMP-binding protein [Phycisphaerales bacterium]